MTGRPSTGTMVISAVVALLVLLPAFGSDFFIDFVMTRTMMLGLAASTIVFLSAYGGMVSLAQWLIFGVSGFMIGNAVAEAGHGLKLGWNPWVAVIFALGIATAVAFVLGALSARTIGIYYLMLTLTYAVIGFLFFGQVTTFSGFGGVTGLDPPGFFLDHPKRLYYAGVVLSVIAYVTFRAVARTSFGIALQGIRDDPVRMSSLGFNVPMHRMLAFTLAGFVAAIAGVLNVWWNGQIDPTSISIGPTLDLLIIAVIGGIAHLEGAWLGAFVFVAANNYLRDLPLVDNIGITEARFNTVIGALVLLIMVLSPDGLMGIIEKVRAAGRRVLGGPTGPTTAAPEPRLRRTSS
ncbi:MAG: branched-chain amino acid ABC transporter permease [Acidimicrobiia bacterium]|nr:branched-chain amino acid ABC transporter permease [Acidimicrobiia bacterium]